MLIAFRVLQGIGAGGLTALGQVIMADIISPRERGRYMGLFGAVMAVGTVGGPLLGGVITDTLGWRWNFFIALPFAVAAIIVLQRTLHLPDRAKRKVKIDYLGVACCSVGVSLLLHLGHARGRPVRLGLLADRPRWSAAPLLALAARDLGGVPRERADHPAARCSRTAPSSSRSSPASPSASRCSAPRSSSASTCSWPAARRRPSPAC